MKVSAVFKEKIVSKIKILYCCTRKFIKIAKIALTARSGFLMSAYRNYRNKAVGLGAPIPFLKSFEEEPRHLWINKMLISWLLPRLPCRAATI